MSLDINLINVQSKPIVVSSNTTAENDRVYHVVANATFTDPTPVEGKGFTVFVRNGNAVVGGVVYLNTGIIIKRVFHSGSWLNYFYYDYSTLSSIFQSISNKSTNVNTDQASDTKYPSVKAVFDWASALFFPIPTGTTAQYLRGDGSLATFPTIPDPTNFVAKADYTPAHSILVQQSGTGAPTSVQIGTNEFLGRKSGGGADIEGLSVSETKAILSYSTADINDSLDKRYVTDAQLTVISNTSGTNTGDQDLSGLVPTSRNLTINGVTQDLSADRTFTVGNKFAIIGNPAVVTAAALTRFISPFLSQNSTSENARSIVIPFDVTINRFYIGTGNVQPATGSSVFTLNKNGVATSITITIPAGSASGIFSDTVNSVSFVAGDLISIEHVNNASGNSAQVNQISISE